jgi:filamentous hemagglutinin
LSGSASPEAREAYNLLIAENDGFQNLLAGATTEHSASAVADILVEKWGMSPEHAAAVMAGAMTLAAGLAAVRGIRNEPSKSVGTPPKDQASIGAIADNEAGGFSFYDRFKKADGTWDWPKDLGFAGNPIKNTLPVGTKLDRYGGPEGSFLSPQGVPFDQRALAPGSKAGGYYQYEVLKPLPVIQGDIAPAFDQPRGGTQILADLPERYNVDRLIKEGFLRRSN